MYLSRVGRPILMSSWTLTDSTTVALEAGSVDLVYDLLDLGLLPDLAGHFAVQGPDDLLNTGDLLNVARG